MAKKVLVEIEVDESGAVKSIQNVDKSLEATTKEANQTNKAIGTLQERADQATGGMISGFKNAAASIKTGVGALNTFRVALAATGIGALLIAITSLVQFFTKTEKGAQSLRVIMAGLGQVVNEITDIFVSLGETIFNAVNSPKTAIKELGEFFTNFIGNAIKNVIDGLGLLGEAASKILDGDFKGAAESAKNGALQLADGLTDLNPATATFKALAEGATNFAIELDKDVRAAIELEKKLNDIKVAERELTVERSQSRAQIEELRSIGQDVAQSSERRIEALQKASALEDELLQKELSIAQAKLETQKAQNELSSSTEEDLQAVADLQARVFDLQAESASRAREVNNQLSSLRQQEQQQRLQAIEEIRQALISENEREVVAVRDKYSKLIELAQKYNQDVKALEEKRLEELQRLAEKEIEIRTGTVQADTRLTEQLAERKVQIVETQNQTELRVEREKSKAVQQLGLTLLNSAAALAEEGTALSKGLNIAQTLANSLAAGIGIWRSSTSLPEPAATINRIAQTAALATQTAIAIRNISKIKLNKGGSAGGGTPSVGGGPSAPSVSQSIGVVAPGSQSQQLTDQLLQGLQANPLRAYAVGQDVSSQQELDRSIIRNGQFG